MRRSEECNSTAGDGRRFRARRQARPESDRRDRGCQPRALREGRGRRTRLPFPRSPKRRACAVETPIPGRRPREAGHGLPRGIGAERSWPEARAVISGRRGRRFRRDASASRRNREGEPGVSPGSPERPRLPTRFVLFVDWIYIVLLR